MRISIRWRPLAWLMTRCSFGFGAGSVVAMLPRGQPLASGANCDDYALPIVAASAELFARRNDMLASLRRSLGGVVSVLLVMALMSTLKPGEARSEAKEVRFARQLGLGYLQFYVMQELKL